MSQNLKPVTVRLPQEDLLLAKEEAQILGVGVGVYLRMIVRQGLRASYDEKQQRAEALLRFSHIIAKETKQKAYTQEDLKVLSKKARKEVAARRRNATS